MGLKWMAGLVVMGLWMPLYTVTHAQTGGRQEAVNILNSLPPDLHAKMQALAQLLDRSIKAGQLTDVEIQQDMLSGRLGDKLKHLNPEAGRLLDEISDAMKNGKGPGEAALLPLLGGLGIAPQ